MPGRELDFKRYIQNHMDTGLKSHILMKFYLGNFGIEIEKKIHKIYIQCFIRLIRGLLNKFFVIKLKDCSLKISSVNRLKLIHFETFLFSILTR